MVANAWAHGARSFVAIAIAIAAPLLFALSQLPSVGRADAATPHTAIDARDHVVFAGDSDYPPFDELDGAGRPTGFDVELFQSVAHNAHLDTEYHLRNWSHVLADLQAGRVDVVPMLVTEERARRYHFSEPYLHRYHLAFGKRGGLYVATIDQLVGHRVAVQRDGMAADELKRLPGITLVQTDTEPDAVRAAHDGRADYAVVPLFVGYDAQRRFALDDIVPLSPAFFETEYAFAVRADRPELVARINQGLRDATRNGELSHLYVQWLANLTPTRETWRSGLMQGVWWVALPLFAIALLLLVRWRQARERAGHLESHDPVTDLANRAGFRKALVPMIAAGKPFAVVRIDLLDIGAVEAMAGHAFVDQLLLQLSARVRQQHALVAMVNDRGFMIAAPGVANPEDAQHAMQHLLQAVNTRVEVAGLPIEQIGCAGAALFPDHGRTPEELMRAATIACEVAYARPGSDIVYSPALAPDARKLTLLTDLRTAIRAGSLGYAVQPKLKLETNRICGAEMLVRWEHPLHGALAPNDFIPLAERTGVIGEMTRFLIDRAIEHARDWRARGLDLTLSVNVSVNDLSDTHIVDAIVRSAEDVRGLLMLEITETAVMRDPDKAFAAVDRLRAGGLRISLDDFGTGNASLTYLRRLAPEEVKIDRSFITGLMQSEADRNIVRSTIQLAHSVRAAVTAEGVEDRATLAWLRDAGCESAQGHGIARPMGVEAFLVLVEEEQAVHMV